MFPNKRQIINRNKQWKIYNAWEATSNRALGEQNLTKLQQWYCEAWEMTRAQNPVWVRQNVVQEKVWRIQNTRKVLALIGEIV